jgi:hypothetical protein
LAGRPIYQGQIVVGQFGAEGQARCGRDDRAGDWPRLEPVVSQQRGKAGHHKGGNQDGDTSRAHDSTHLQQHSPPIGLKFILAPQSCSARSCLYWLGLDALAASASLAVDRSAGHTAKGGAERTPTAADPKADRDRRRDDGNGNKAEQHGVLKKGGTFFVPPQTNHKVDALLHDTTPVHYKTFEMKGSKLCAPANVSSARQAADSGNAAIPPRLKMD